MIEASQQPLAALGIGLYVVIVLFATKIPYEMMISRGVEHIRAVYYNRKIVHMMAGGIGSFLRPCFYSPVFGIQQYVVSCSPYSLGSRT